MIQAQMSYPQNVIEFGLFDHIDGILRNDDLYGTCVYQR